MFSRSLIAVVVAAVLFTGCASSDGVAPNRAELARLGNDPSAQVRAVVHKPAPFVLTSAAKVGVGSMFGMIGAGIAANSMEKAGQELIASAGVADPAAAVRDRVAEALRGQYGIEPVVVETAPPSDSVAELKKTLGSGVVFDVRTLGWQLLYYPTDWTHHYVLYMGRARLVRLDDGKVLWDGRCLHKLPDAQGQRKTVDEYRADGGVLLREKIEEAANGCAETLIAHLSGGAPRPVASP